MYLQRRVYTSNPTTGTKHYVYLNGASLLSVACHNRINPTPFRLRHPTQLLFFLFLCFLCLVTSVVVPARFKPRHFHVVKVASPSSFFASRCTHSRDTRALVRIRGHRKPSNRETCSRGGGTWAEARAPRLRFRLMDRSGPGGARQ